eukprot:TRINITY_DN137_c0_g1_i1.p1 TRINITY_DN137_c0_g1~~TRINITY_DN137_c0_g1_i1.p1  ORF type:complete len:770 (-),score=223.81 TRINITY_DN137_c0_g1_i1:222-2531(-)
MMRFRLGLFLLFLCLAAAAQVQGVVSEQSNTHDLGLDINSYSGPEDVDTLFAEGGEVGDDDDDDGDEEDMNPLLADVDVDDHDDDDEDDDDNDTPAFLLKSEEVGESDHEDIDTDDELPDNDTLVTTGKGFVIGNGKGWKPPPPRPPPPPPPRPPPPPPPRPPPPPPPLPPWTPPRPGHPRPFHNGGGKFGKGNIKVAGSRHNSDAARQARLAAARLDKARMDRRDWEARQKRLEDLERQRSKARADAHAATLARRRADYKRKASAAARRLAHLRNEQHRLLNERLNIMNNWQRRRHESIQASRLRRARALREFQRRQRAWERRMKRAEAEDRRRKKMMDRLRSKIQARRLDEARERKMASMYQTQIKHFYNSPFTCRKMDCFNPKKCYNGRGDLINSQKFQKAVYRSGVYYANKNSNYYWSKCRWVLDTKNVQNCDNPTLMRIAGRMALKPYKLRKHFVHVNGKWYKNKRSNWYYEDCKWKRERVGPHPHNPTVRKLAGRWVRKPITKFNKEAMSHYTKRFGKWYKSKRYKYVYRNGKWHLSHEWVERNQLKRIREAKAKAVRAKKLRKRLLKRYKEHVAAELKRLNIKNPLHPMFNKLTTADMMDTVNKLSHQQGKKQFEAFTKYFLKQYLPRSSGRINDPVSDNLARKFAKSEAARLHAEAHAQKPVYRYLDSDDPEPNQLKRDTQVRYIASSQRDMNPQTAVVDEDQYDPEAGATDQEPGSVARGARNNFEVVGEQAGLRDQGRDAASNPPPSNPDVDPTLSGHV